MRYKSLNKEFLDTPKETGKAFGTEKKSFTIGQILWAETELLNLKVKLRGKNVSTFLNVLAAA